MDAAWEEASVVVDRATIRYRSRGDGPPIVFVHGVYVGGTLWSKVADLLPGYRCILPTWPLGAQRDRSPGADLSALATSRRIPAFLDALELHDVTLVGNDTGGGLCLGSLGSGLPGLDRIGRLVLTNCDSYEHFPPKGFDAIVKISRGVPPVGAALLRFFASKAGQKAFLKSVCARPPATADVTDVFEAFITSKEARHDALTVTTSLAPSVTLGAVDALKAFTKPVLLAWGDKDKLFPLDHARRLEADFPDATLEVIADASTFVMLDQPDALATAISRFVEAGPRT